MDPDKALAIIFSFIALLISAFSLGWNVYRDVILKAWLRVHFSASRLIGPSGSFGDPFLALSIVNHGPGDIICGMPMIRRKPWFQGVFGESTVETLIYDYTNPISFKPPFKLAVGEQAQVTFPITDKCFLDDPVFRIGIMDSFGRLHWAPRKDIHRAREQMEEFRRQGK